MLNYRSSTLDASLVLAAAAVPASLSAAMPEQFKETAAACKACHKAFEK